MLKVSTFEKLPRLSTLNKNIQSVKQFISIGNKMASRHSSENHRKRATLARQILLNSQSRRHLLNLVIFVIFLFNIISCDSDAQSSNSGVPFRIRNGRNSSRRNFKNLHVRSHDERSAPAFDEAHWQTPTRRSNSSINNKNGKRKHRLNKSSDKSANEILRSRNSPSIEFDPMFASSSSQNNQFQSPNSAALYANQSILSRQPFLQHSRGSSVPRAIPHSSRHHHHHNRIPPEELNKKRPNIIFMLTDDQDIELGSMNYMPKTMKILSEGGVHVKNAYVTTPMCCPSRSSILTGLYVHNHNVYTNGENCSSTQWQQTHERRTFATYLRDSGYRTAFFGKYLNEYNGSYIPPGWSDWSALVRNSRYYNYTLNVNGDRVRHGADYELDYYPDLILNDSLQYMRYSKRFFSSKPYLMVLSFPSPHGPEDAAPQYQDMFFREKGHRTPSWNYAPNSDKQWILRHTRRMTPLHQEFTDFLNAKRLQTLQSIDEAVHQLYTELKALGELDNTYIVYTSDHGYHLGQFGLVKGKAMPFEFDIRVPFYVRGPNIPRNRVLPQIVLNIDIAPTLLDIAGLKVPSHMDGVSALPYIKQLNTPNKINSEGKKPKALQRDSFLIEKGIDGLLIPIIGKKQWLQLECQKPEYQSPCKLYQKFECFQDENGTYRIRKCHRNANRNRLRQRQWGRDKCICTDTNKAPSEKAEEVSTRDFDNDVIKRYGLNANHQYRHRRTKKHKNGRNTNDRRRKRSEEAMSIESDLNDFDVAGVYKLKRFIDLARAPASTGLFDISNHKTNSNIYSNAQISNITTDELVSILGTESLPDFSNFTDYLNKTFCTVTRTNLSIECSEEIYRDQVSWKEKKQYIDTAISHLQRRLFELRGIRRFMNDKRPKNNSQNSDFCQCDGDQEGSLAPDRESPYPVLSRQSKHPRRYVERHFRKHLHRKKWINKKEKKQRRKEKFENTTCEMAASEQMNCFTHDNDHWKTPPFWTHGPFCFCQNALNNSFWCLRTINETHNLLYCEFVTGFITYYDLNKDPFQLRNAIYDLEMSTVEGLSAKLAKLKSCSGAAQCGQPNMRSNVRRFTDNLAAKKGALNATTDFPAYSSGAPTHHRSQADRLQHFWRHSLQHVSTTEPTASST